MPPNWAAISLSRMADAAPGEARHADAGMITPSRHFGDAQSPQANAGPRRIGRAAADTADGLERRRAKFRQAAIPQRLDIRDALEHALEKQRLIVGARCQARRIVGIGNREAFARARQRIVIEAGWRIRLHQWCQLCNVLAREQRSQYRATGI